MRYPVNVPLKDLCHFPTSVNGNKLGLELEFENSRTSHDDVMGPWRTVEELSLRNNGIEFVSSQPCSIKQARHALSTLYRHAKQKGLESSTRTGFHIHYNVQDKTVKDITGLLVAYLILEPVLYNFCGSHRESSIFCVPWYKSDSTIEDVRKLVRGKWGSTRQFNKYCGLNLNKVAYYGTVEFRQAPTFERARKARVWLNCTYKLCREFSQTSFKDTLRLYEREGVLSLLQKIFVKESDGAFFFDQLTEDPARLVEMTETDCLAEYIVSAASNPLSVLNPVPQPPPGVRRSRKGFPWHGARLARRHYHGGTCCAGASTIESPTHTRSSA
jgi:hypothetical protein